MKAIVRLMCSSCGKKFVPGHKGNGIPNGVGFVLNNGNVINMCADCLMDMDKVNAICNEVNSGDE